MEVFRKKLSVILAAAMILTMLNRGAVNIFAADEISLSTTQMTLYLDGEKTLPLKVNNAGSYSCVYISSDTSVATADSLFFTVTAQGVGRTTVTVTVSDGSTVVKTLKCSVTVLKTADTATATPTKAPTSTPTKAPTATPTNAPTATPTVSAASMKLSSGSSVTLYLDGDTTLGLASSKTISVTNKKYCTVSYTSGKTSVASVTAVTGKVTAKAVGTAVITAVVKNGTKTIKVLKCTFTVKRHAKSVGLRTALITELKNGITEGTSVSSNVGYRKAKNGSLYYGTGKTYITDSIVYLSSNKSVFTVNKTTGKIKAVAPGTAKLTIYASSSDNGSTYTTTEKKTYTVKVKAAPTPTPDPSYGKITGATQGGLSDMNVVMVTFSDESDASRVTNNSSLLKVINVKTGKTVAFSSIRNAADSKNVLVTFKSDLTSGTVEFIYNNDTFDMKCLGYVPAAVQITNTSVIMGNSTLIEYRVYNDYGLNISSYFSDSDVTVSSAKTTDDYYVNGKYITFNKSGTTATLKFTITSDGSTYDFSATMKCN
jgi:uncharacterized protein YjdB